MTDIWHLRKVAWIETLATPDREAVRQASTTRLYKQGEAIFAPSPHPEHVYLLEEGLVRLFRLSEQGEEFTTGYVRPGEVFGEVPVMVDQPRMNFAEARRRSRILRIPREGFLRAVQSSKAVLFEVTKKIGQRLLTCQSRAEDLVFHSVPVRLARLLLRLAEDFGKKDDRRVSVGLVLSQKELAALVGATRQTVSATLREMINAGLIERRGRELFLADPARLRRRAHLPEPDPAK